MDLPVHPWVLSERLAVTVGKTPYVHFDLNDYSVPNTLVRRALAVLADEHTVHILDGTTEVALHPQSWSQAEQIEQDSHVKALVAHKRQARAHRAVDRPVQPDPVAARRRGTDCPSVSFAALVSAHRCSSARPARSRTDRGDLSAGF